MATNCTSRKKQLSIAERARLFWITDQDVLEKDLFGDDKTVVDVPQSEISLRKVVYLPKEE